MKRWVIIHEIQTGKIYENEVLSGENNTRIFLINYLTHIHRIELPYDVLINHTYIIPV